MFLHNLITFIFKMIMLLSNDYRLLFKLYLNNTLYLTVKLIQPNTYVNVLSFFVLHQLNNLHYMIHILPQLTFIPLSKYKRHKINKQKLSKSV